MNAPSKTTTHLNVAGLALGSMAVLAVILACSASAPVEEPASPAAAPTGECAKDTDCKGDRICSKGECQAPR